MKSRYECQACRRFHTYESGFAGPALDAARVAGWRFGRNCARDPVVYCPECVGTDDDFWDRMTLDMAYMAGIDAGRRQ